jgi:hypothetical protein
MDPTDLPARILDKIVFDGLTGCWKWTGATSTRGYGSLGWAKDGLGGRTHRVVYELLVGPIPEGLVLDHLCRLTRCVNPAHLEPVTQKVNIERGLLPSRRTVHNTSKTRCPAGHPYDEANTYQSPKTGNRGCLICRRASSAVSNEKIRQLRLAASRRS